MLPSRLSRVHPMLFSSLVNVNSFSAVFCNDNVQLEVKLSNWVDRFLITYYLTYYMLEFEPMTAMTQTNFMHKLGGLLGNGHKQASKQSFAKLNCVVHHTRYMQKCKNKETDLSPRSEENTGSAHI